MMSPPPTYCIARIKTETDGGDVIYRRCGVRTSGSDLCAAHYAACLAGAVEATEADDIRRECVRAHGDYRRGRGGRS